jgi:hypothetical protein
VLTSSVWVVPLAAVRQHGFLIATPRAARRDPAPAAFVHFVLFDASFQNPLSSSTFVTSPVRATAKRKME